MTDLPPLPNGFVIKNTAPAASGSLPPVPPGFRVRGSQAAPAAAPAARKPDFRGSILPFSKNGETGEISLAVPQILKDIGDAFTLPGDVYSGKADLNSDETMGRVIGLAGLANGGAMPTSRVVTAQGARVPAGIVSGLEADKVPIEEIASRLTSIGPDAKIADLGPTLQNKAAAIATSPGPGANDIVEALTARKDAAPDRMREVLDAVFGKAVVPSDVQAEIKVGKRALGPSYDAALAQAGPVDTAPLAASLDASVPKLRGEAQTALKSVRGMLDQTGKSELDTNPETLFQTRQAIDGLLNGSADGNVSRVLQNTRQGVDEILAQKAPGIKQVDGQYSELSRQSDAIDRGQTVLSSGRDAPRPSELAAEVAAGALPKGEMVGPSAVPFRLSQGARAEIERVVGTNLNDRAALNKLLKGEGDWNYSRLSTLFGKDKTDEMYRILDGERTMAKTESDALAGSKTAKVTAAQREINGAPKGPGVVREAMNFRFGDAAANLADKALGGVASRRRDMTNSEIAQILMSDDPLRRQEQYGSMPIGALVAALLGVDNTVNSREAAK